MILWLTVYVLVGYVEIYIQANKVCSVIIT